MAGKHESNDPRFDNRYMAKVEELRKLIRDWMGEENLNQKAAAGEARIAPGTLARFLNGKTMAPLFSTLTRMAFAAGVEIEFRKARRPKKRKRTEYFPLRQPKRPRRR